MSISPFQLFEKSLLQSATPTSTPNEINFNVVYLFQMLYEDRHASEIDFNRFSVEDIDRAMQLIEGNAIYVDDDYETVDVKIDEYDYARQHSDHEYIVTRLFNDKQHSRFKESRRIFI